MADDGVSQDMIAGLQDLQTRRQLALALLQQSQQDQGTQMAGQVAIRNSALSPLVGLMRMYEGRQQLNSLPAQQQALIDAHQQRLADATTALIGAGQTSQGTPTVITEGAGPPTESGDTSLMVKQGTPAGFGDPAMLGKALAQYGAVGGNPQLSSSILQKRMAMELAQSMNPGMAQPAEYGNAPMTQPDFPGAPVAGPAQMTIPPTPMMGGGGGGQGGGIYGVNMPAQLQAALMAGLPGAKEAMELYGKMNAPMEMKPGSFVYDPTIKGMRAASPGEYGQPVIQNGAVVRYDAIPGQAANKAAAAGAVAGAEATATLPTKLVTVSLGGGKTIELPGDMALDLARRGLGQIAPVGAPAGAPAPVPGPAGGPAPAAVAVPNAATATTAAPGMAGPQGTTDTKPYYGSFPAVPQAPVTIGMGQSTAEKTFSETEAKNWGAQSEEVSVKGRDAANAIQRANEIKQLSSNFTPGKITPVLADTAAWLDSVGIPKSIVNGVGQGDLASYQTLSQLLTQNSLGSVKEALPGQRIGQQEVMLTAAKSPNPSMTKAAIDASMDYNIGNARWQVAKMAARDDWMARPGATYNGFENFWAQNNPPAKFMPSEAQVNATLGIKGAPQAATGAPGATRTAQASPAPAAGPLRAVDAKGNMIELVNGAWAPVRAVSGNW